MLHIHSISENLNSSLQNSGSRLLCLFWLVQHVRGKKLNFASTLKESLLSFSPFTSFFGKCFSYLAGYSRINFLQQDLYKSQHFKLVYITEFVKEVMVVLQQSQICILKYEKPNQAVFSVFNGWFQQLRLIHFFHCNWSFEDGFVDCILILSNISWWYIWIYPWSDIQGGVTQMFHCFCYSYWIRFFMSFSSSINHWLDKNNETVLKKNWTKL